MISNSMFLNGTMTKVRIFIRLNLSSKQIKSHKNHFKVNAAASSRRNILGFQKKSIHRGDKTPTHYTNIERGYVSKNICEYGYGC